jgi:serine/threonine protein kinase
MVLVLPHLLLLAAFTHALVTPSLHVLTPRALIPLTHCLSRHSNPDSTSAIQVPQLNMHDFQVTKVLGSGYFATVYKVTHGDSVYALKVFNKHACSTDIDREISILASLESPFTVNILGETKLARDDMPHLDVDETRAIVMEYIDGQTLAAILQSTPILPESTARQIATQLLHAIESIHSSGVVHGDIKPTNIILTSTLPYPSLKLVDFGLAEYDTTNQIKIPDGMFVYKGTQYAAPEIWEYRSQTHGRMVDYYSLGIVIYEMLNGRVPFDATDERDIYELILEFERTGVWMFKGSREVEDVVRRLVEVDWRLRGGSDGVQEVLEMEWFKN